jgi:hypothetical protein
MPVFSSIITIFESETIPLIIDDVYRGQEIEGKFPIEELIAFVNTLPSAVAVERRQGDITILRLTDPECLPTVLRKWRQLIESAAEAASRTANLNRKFSQGEGELKKIPIASLSV